MFGEPKIEDFAIDLEVVLHSLESVLVLAEDALFLDRAEGLLQDVLHLPELVVGEVRNSFLKARSSVETVFGDELIEHFLF